MLAPSRGTYQSSPRVTPSTGRCARTSAADRAPGHHGEHDPGDEHRSRSAPRRRPRPGPGIRYSTRPRCRRSARAGQVRDGAAPPGRPPADPCETSTQPTPTAAQGRQRHLGPRSAAPPGAQRVVARHVVAVPSAARHQQRGVGHHRARQIPRGRVQHGPVVVPGVTAERAPRKRDHQIVVGRRRARARLDSQPAGSEPASAAERRRGPGRAAAPGDQRERVGQDAGRITRPDAVLHTRSRGPERERAEQPPGRQPFLGVPQQPTPGQPLTPPRRRRPGPATAVTIAHRASATATSSNGVSVRPPRPRRTPGSPATRPRPPRARPGTASSPSRLGGAARGFQIPAPAEDATERSPHDILRAAGRRRQEASCWAAPVQIPGTIQVSWTATTAAASAARARSDIARPRPPHHGTATSVSSTPPVGTQVPAPTTSTDSGAARGRRDGPRASAATSHGSAA